MQIVRTIISGRWRFAGVAARAAAGLACALCLVGCNTDQQVTGAPEVPTDYRLRHPITLQESDRTLELLIGSNRGELNPTQRAQVLSFGLDWKRNATGGIVIARPVDSTNERAAADAMTEIVSILSAAGMPPASIAVQTYPGGGPKVAPIRITYPRIHAQAGPCGLWPEDIGPSMNRDYFENQPPWNFGCATQRNLAAEVDNPADLVQPRAETAPYQMRRTSDIEKYRQPNPVYTAPTLETININK
jgi:pilus assembly protein CpaD